MIGEIIQKQRLALGMSRKELAEGICSEKYIYLIEKDERNPSAYILNSLSDRLGLDLFKYYQFLDTGETTKILEHRQNIERYIQTSDVESLKKESVLASKLKAFQEEPLIYDIQMINLFYEAVIHDKRKKAIQQLTELLEKDKLNIDPVTLLNAYAALAVVYQLEGQWDAARTLLETAYQKIENKTESTRYNTTIITILILITSLLYNTGEYEELIKYSHQLMEFQEKYNEYNRFYYVDFYLSFAYYKLNKLDKAFDHFMRGGYSALLFENEVDIYYITKMPGFTEVAEGVGIDPRFIDQLYNILK